jgi:hypothetical protein
LSLIVGSFWIGRAFQREYTMRQPLRGYPETLSSYHSAITQHSRDSETQGDRKEQAYAA